MMLNKLLPRSIDNTYSGRKIALWLLGLVVLAKAAMGLNTIFNGYEVATTADHIPLATFTPAAAGAVVTFLALWGLSQLIFSLLGALALVRYRAMVPLVFLVLLLELLARKAIVIAMPLAKAGSSGVPVNTIFLALMVAGLVLSLWTPNKQAGVRP